MVTAPRRLPKRSRSSSMQVSKSDSGLSRRLTKMARHSDRSSAAYHRRVVVVWGPSASTMKRAVSLAAMAV